MDQELNIFREGVTKEYLKQTLGSRGVRVAIVLVMSLSWFALVNHCELAAAAPPKPAQAHSCCEEDKGADKAPVNNDHNSSIECCKAVHPALAPIGDTISPDLSSGSPAQVPADVVLPDVRPSTDILELDTGPPFVSSFVELVLQRSILAHAPPYSV